MTNKTPDNAGFFSLMSRRFFLAAIFVYILNSSYAQQLPCNSITGEMGYTVKEVKIKSWWVPGFLQKEVEELTGLNAAFDPARLNPAQNHIKEILIQTEGSIAARLINGSMSVLYITSDVCDISIANGPKEVLVTYKAWYLRVDLINIGNNRLPIPRTARPVFYAGVPKLLRATFPVFAIQTDRDFGTSISLQTITDLLNINGTDKKAIVTRKPQLDLGINLRKSLSQPFYSAGASLHLFQKILPDSAIGWHTGFFFSKEEQPLYKEKNVWLNLALQAGIAGSVKNSLLAKYNTGIYWKFLRSNFAEQGEEKLQRSENGLGVFAIADGKPGKAFSRWGIWLDNAYPRNNSSAGTYQRLVSKLGYAISLGKNHSQVDLEAQTGFGHIWGRAPAYNQFYAGNQQWNFLYNPLQSTRNQFMPTGPLLRSMGERGGGYISASETTGAQTFWNFNLNIAIPVTFLSKPLIPAIVISDEPRVITLRSALKSQSETVKNFIINDLVETKGYPDDESTDSVAAGIVNRDIRPTLNFLADKANVYSLKPVLLFDVAGMRSKTNGYVNWVGAGLGVQLNIVVARFEAAYMHTLAPQQFNKNGNFFMRLTIQNFY